MISGLRSANDHENCIVLFKSTNDQTKEMLDFDRPMMVTARLSLGSDRPTIVTKRSLDCDRSTRPVND